MDTQLTLIFDTTPAENRPNVRKLNFLERWARLRRESRRPELRVERLRRERGERESLAAAKAAALAEKRAELAARRQALEVRRSEKRSRPRSKKYMLIPPVANIIEFAHGRLALRCLACNGLGEHYGALNSSSESCRSCEGHAFLFIDPYVATTCERGSEGRVQMYVSRYQAGVPLFRDDDFGGESESDTIIRHSAEDNPESDLSDDLDEIDVPAMEKDDS